MPKLTTEEVLDGVRRAYRTLPPIGELNYPREATRIWIGQTRAILALAHINIDTKLTKLQSYPNSSNAEAYFSDIKQALIDVISKLELDTGGYSFVVKEGNVFDYFEETRKILDSAKKEIFLVDPYVTANIVGDYFTQIDPHVAIRVLTSNKQHALAIVPAATKLAQQNNMSIGVRTRDNMHDRFWFIDGITGYQSSASINDGGNRSPAVIMKLTDAFDAVKQIYEDFWQASKPKL